MLQRRYFVTSQAQDALKKLLSSDMEVADSGVVVDFIKKISAEHQLVVQVHQKFAEKLAAKDPVVEKEWEEYLNGEVNIDPIPLSCFKLVKVLSPQDQMALEPLVQGGVLKFPINIPKPERTLKAVPQ